MLLKIDSLLTFGKSNLKKKLFYNFFLNLFLYLLPLISQKIKSIFFLQIFRVSFIIEVGCVTPNRTKNFVQRYFDNFISAELLCFTGILMTLLEVLEMYNNSVSDVVSLSATCRNVEPLALCQVDTDRRIFIILRDVCVNWKKLCWSFR